MLKIKSMLILSLFLNMMAFGKPMKSYYMNLDWQVEKKECYGEYDPLTDSQDYPKEPILLKKIYSDGTLHMSVPCFRGKLNGIQKTYYKSGKLESEIPFKSDSRDGKSIYYYEDGNISQIEFVKDGYIDGNSTYYFPDGSLQGYCFYKDGLRQGRCYQLEINFKSKKKALRYENSYVNGVRKGLEIESQGALFYGFTTIAYRKGEKNDREYEDSLRVFRSGQEYRLRISINKKKLKDKDRKRSKCIYKWVEERGKLLSKSPNIEQKDLKEECFSDINF